MQLLTKQRRHSTINITSLIDVLFLLLIFLMVSSSFLEEPGMKLSLPEAESAEVGEKKAFTLYITEGGDLFLNGEKVPLDSLEIHVEVSEEMFSDEVREMAGIEKRIKAEVESILGIAVRLKLVEPRSIARSEGKAVRVIDRRST